MLEWLFSDPLPVGSQAPPFELRDEEGHFVRLESFRGSREVALFFYPGDDTPVCTKQACEFRDFWQDFEAARIAVFGVNPSGSSSHKNFRRKHALPYPLLIDEGRRVAKLYRAGGWLVRRTVYLIGLDGRIRFAKRGKPHPLEVVAASGSSQSPTDR